MFDNTTVMKMNDKCLRFPKITAPGRVSSVAASPAA